MKFGKKYLLILTIFLFSVSGVSSAANYYVRDGASGSNNGSDWTNAYTDLPSTLSRGSTYYIADGSYSGYTFNDAVSGTSLITIKKAIASDHGTSTGWSSGYGDGLATFGSFTFTTDYWVIDGQTGGGPGSWESGFGIKLDATGARIVRLDNNASNITFSHVDMEHYGRFTDEHQDGIYGLGSSDNITVSYCYMHDICRCHILTRGTDGFILEYSKLARNGHSDGIHREAWSAGVDDNVTIRYCIFEDISNTAFIALVNGVGDAENWQIYGNVFYRTPGDGSGVSRLIEVKYANPDFTVGVNWKIYNNAIVNLQGLGAGIDIQNGSGNVAKNNIFYNNTVSSIPFSNTSHDYNWFEDNYRTSGCSPPCDLDPDLADSETNGIHGSADPFVDWENGDFDLTSGTNARDNGTDLGSSYDEDAYGNTRGADSYWDIGAYEYVSGANDTTAPSPDPMTWSTDPYATGDTSISMTATTATDVSGVEYYFDCTAGGGHDSSWQDSTTYEDTGLSASTQYTYQVKARDKSSNQNETAYSTTKSATTNAADTTAPSPDPMTWATEPNATGTSSISMTATTATDTSGVEYYFDCTAGGGNDSSWQDSTTYQDTGLDANTTYTYRVKARDKSSNQNETGYSTTKSATTNAGADIEFDAVSSESSNVNGTTLSWSHTIGSGDNRILIVGISGEDSSSSDLNISSVKYNNVSMNLVTGSSATVGPNTLMKTELYYLLEASLPTSDSYTVTVTYSGSVSARTGGATSLANVKQQAAEAVATNTNTDQTTISTNITTSTNGAWVVDAVGCGNPGGGYTTTTSSMVERYDENSGYSTGAGSTKPIATAGSTTMSWLYGGTGNRQAHSVAAFAPTSQAQPDTTSPSPDPMTWATEPYATGASSISMTATTATDSSGVEYYFDCTAGGGNDSSWQDSATYEDTGLSASTQYTYRVKARDKSSNQNETAYSTTKSATTDAPPDTTPPSPDPMTWATDPYATGATSISMTSTTATDTSGVEYYFDCTAGGGNDSGWQDSATYEDTGLSELTEYTYRVKARDKSSNQNETAYSTTKSATTQDGTDPSPDPMTWATEPYATGTSSISMTATTATDASGVEYYFDCTAGGGNDSSWQDSTTYEDTGLSASTQYTYKVRARDKSSNQNATSWSTEKSATTDANEPEPTGWWQLDETSGSTAADSSGNSYDGTVTGATWDSNGYIDGALNFDGTTTYRCEIPSSALSVSAGTVSVWGRMEGTQSGTRYFFGHKSDPNNDANWADSIQLYMDNSDTVLDLGFGGVHPRHANIMTLSTNTWYHIVLTWDGTNYVVYVDGVSKASGTYTGLTTLASFADIGNNGSRGNYPQGFAGLIDDVLIYDGALSKYDIADLAGITIASNPSPADNATDVSTTADLSWSAGYYAADVNGHDVYFGTDYNSVADANHSSSEYKGVQDSNSYDPGTMSNSTTYYWAIDEVNDSNTWMGEVWSFTTEAAGDTTPPSPDPMTWATEPNATGTSSISMTATTATDSSGVEYYFDCTAGGGNDSGWQDSTTYEDTGLDPNTQYSYRVKARDKSTNQNETAYSTVKSATTNAAQWTQLTYDEFESGWGSYTGGGNVQRYTDGDRAHQGDCALDIQGAYGDASAIWHTNAIDVHTSSYTQIEIDFWYYPRSMEGGEGFKVEYYDGTQWNEVADYRVGVDFENEVFEHPTIYINESQYTFPTNMKIKFISDTSNTYDDAYLDEIKVSAK